MVGVETVTTTESVVVFSAASVAVVRMTILSPFLNDVAGMTPVRVLDTWVGLSVTVSVVTMTAPLRTVVETVETPLSSFAVTLTVTGTPSPTALLTAPTTAKASVGRATSSSVLDACVGSRVSQLLAITAPTASATKRIENLECVIMYSTDMRLRPHDVGRLCSLIDDVRGDENEQV